MRRLNIRIQEDDYTKLEELRRVLFLRSDSETIRYLVRLHHAAERNALRQLKKLEKETPEVSRRRNRKAR